MGSRQPFDRHGREAIPHLVLPFLDHGDGSRDPFEDEGAIVDLSRYSVRWSTRAMTFSLALPHGSEVSATVQNHRHQRWHYQQGKKWITRTVPVNPSNYHKSSFPKSCSLLPMVPVRARTSTSDIRTATRFCVR